MTKAQGIIELYDAVKGRVIELTRSPYAIYALDWIFRHPVFRSSDFITQLDGSNFTARRILNLLRDGGIVDTIVEGRGRQPAVMAFSALLDIVEGEGGFQLPK